MKIATYYSHLNGFEWLQYHHKGIWNEIQDIITNVDASKYRTKISKERNKHGNAVFSPGALNKRLKKDFEALKWKESRTNYWVTDNYGLITRTLHLPENEQKAEIIAANKTPIKSYNQTDFVKNRVAVEIQFGKYSFIAYDLFVKHLAFYVGNTIDLGIEILPMKSMQAQMSSESIK